MGTDREEVYNEKCICGKGTMRILFCTPDHPYHTSSQWFDKKIDCDECKSNYKIIAQEEKHVLVTISDFKDKEELEESYQKGSDETMNSSQAKSLLSDLASLIDSEKSVAAIYRTLYGAGLVLGSEGTFRRNYSNSSDWIKNNIYPYYLERVMKLLSKNDTNVYQILNELKKIREDIETPLPIVGEPFIKNKRPFAI